MNARITFVSAILLACSAALPAQYCHSENGGPNFNNGVSMGGPLLLGIKFTAPSALTVAAIEVFTGEGSGTNTLAIWSHNAGLNQPLANLGGSGSWAMSATNSWQGAALPAPVSLSSATIYWLVWSPVGGSQASVDNPGAGAVTQQYRGSFDGGANWNGPFTFSDRPWKFRFTCGALPWQVNQPCAALSFNGVLSNGLAPASLAVSSGATVTASLGGSTGLPYDVGFTFLAPLIPSLLVTPGGQTVNLDITSSTLAFLLGGSFATPFAPATIPFIMAPSGLEVEAQMILLTPLLPDGFCLSQGAAVGAL